MFRTLGSMPSVERTTVSGWVVPLAASRAELPAEFAQPGPEVPAFAHGQARRAGFEPSPVQKLAKTGSAGNVRTNRSLKPFVSPGTRSLASPTRAIRRPSSEIDGES